MKWQDFTLDLLAWQTIDHIAGLEKIELTDLCDLIESYRGGQSFQQAVRSFSVAYYRSCLTEKIEDSRYVRFEVVADNTRSLPQNQAG